MIEIPAIEKELLIKLKIDETNPNVMTKDQIQSVANSIKKYGFIIPIIVNKDNVIIDGHQRKSAAELLDMLEVPVIRLNVDKVDAKLLKQIMNKLKGQHDYELDLEEYKVILDAQGNLDDLKKYVAMSDEHIENLLREISPKGSYTEEELDEVPDVERIKTDIKLGDMFKLDNHYVLCGDATKKEDVDRLMQGKKADMVFTDPPYNVNNSGKNELLNLYEEGNRIQTPLQNDILTEQEYDKFNDLWFNNVLDMLNDYNSVYVCGSHESFDFIKRYKAFIISNILVWVKNGMVLGRKDYKGQHEYILYGWKTHHKWYGDNSQTTIWNFNKPTRNDLHPTMKPVELIEKAINNSSQYNQIVLDVFLGSGSTLIACENTNRICYGLEIDPVYVETTIQRWEKLTNKQREKIN